MKKKRRINPYVLISILTAAALILSIAAVVAISGKSYTVIIDDTSYSDEKVDAADITVSYKNEGILETDNVYVSDNNSICVDVHSVKSGDTDILVRVKGAGFDWVRALYVNPSGTVIETEALDFTGYHYAETVILLSFAFVSVMMILAFFDCRKKAQFDYSMIAYGGVAIFSAALCLYPAAKLISWLPVQIDFRTFLYYITETGIYFVLVSVPLMLLVCGAFAFSNLWLIRHEGFRPVNLLGIALGAVWLAGIVIVFTHDSLLWEILSDPNMAYMAFYSIAYVITLMICLFFSVMISAYLAVRYKPGFDKAYIIILGCCIRSNGDLTPLLKSRADSALAFEKQQYEKTGRHAKFVPSGGQGSDEIISESEAIKRYLLTQGVPEDRILKEDRSVNTDQNIAFSRGVIAADCEDIDRAQAAFATTNYHVFRGYVLSKKHKLNAQGISAKTKWYFFPNAFLREFIGLLFEKKLALTGILALIVAMFLWIEHLISII